MSALHEVRVIDFGHHVAGPVLGMHLADLGAEVIAVRKPGIEPSGAASIWDRDKASRAIDLATESGRSEARELVAGADVVLENFRPATAERFGIDGASLTATHPGLIHVTMPAFGRDDPRTALPGWEQVVLAALDTFRPVTTYGDVFPMLHEPPPVRRGAPVFTAEPMASMFAATIAALAVNAALLVRDRTGVGQTVEVPLFDAMIQGIGIYGLSKLPFHPITNAAFGPWDDSYRCSDGRMLQIVCTMPRHAQGAARLLGREDFIERGMCERGLPERNPELVPELAEFLEESFKTATAQHWEDSFAQAGLPAAVVRSPEEWFDHPQAREGGLVRTVDTENGPIEGPDSLVRVQPRPAPATKARRDASVPESATDPPLAGVRVLDLAVILAGPTAGRTLAELGADVIKIDPPKKQVLYHRDINRGKRHVRLDLQHRAGRKAFFRLLDTADIVVQNFRAGVMDRLGLGEAELFKRRPDLVYVTLNAYGDRGPWADRPGYEETAEALTGMQVRFGGVEHPAVWPYGVVNDYGTGIAAAMGTIAALRERNRTGHGQVVHASLARTATVLQSTYLHRIADEVAPMPGGRECRGIDERHRLVRCADGWIAMGARSSAEIPADLDQRARIRASAEVIAELAEIGAGAHSLVWLNDVLDEPHVEERGLAVTLEHYGGRHYRTTGPGRWLSTSEVVAGLPAPRPGADAESVFADIGRSGDIAGLVKRGVLEIPGYQA